MHLDVHPTIILAQMVPFVVLIIALKAWVFDPLLDYLEERHRRIHGFSSEAKSSSGEIERRIQEIDQRLHQARVANASMRTSVLQAAAEEDRRVTAEARARAAEMAEKFRQDVSRQQKLASQQLRLEVEEMARGIASRAIGRPVN